MPYGGDGQGASGTFRTCRVRLRCPLIGAKLTSHMIGAFPFAALVAPFV